MLVIYVFLKREKNLTLKTCAPDFSARSMTKLYAKIKGARAISLFDFPKTWQVCITIIEHNLKFITCHVEPEQTSFEVCMLLCFSICRSITFIMYNVS